MKRKENDKEFIFNWHAEIPECKSLAHVLSMFVISNRKSRINHVCAYSVNIWHFFLWNFAWKNFPLHFQLIFFIRNYTKNRSSVPIIINANIASNSDIVHFFPTIIPLIIFFEKKAICIYVIEIEYLLRSSRRWKVSSCKQHDGSWKGKGIIKLPVACMHVDT